MQATRVGVLHTSAILYCSMAMPSSAKNIWAQAGPQAYCPSWQTTDSSGLSPLRGQLPPAPAHCVILLYPLVTVL
jgi:hypothetical protein